MNKEQIRDFVNNIYKIIKKSNYEFMKYINVDFNIIMTIGEYFKSNAFKDNLRLDRINKIPKEVKSILYEREKGSYSKGNIFIYANNLIAPLGKKIGKGPLTMLVFHELRHALQEQYQDNSLESIIYQMEKEKHDLTYLTMHDSLFAEIDAKLSGIVEAKKFIENNPSLYSESDNYFLDRKLDETKYLVNNYDYDNLFLNYSAHKLKHPKYKTNLEWERLMFDENGYIRSLEDIINDELFSHVDRQFIRKFITSEVFANSIDINNLSDKSIEFLYEQYNFSYKEEKNNYEELKLKKENDRIIRFQNKSLKRLDRYETVLDELDKIISEHKTLQRRRESLGYISVISMTIGLLILICIFMLFVILKVRI